MQLQIFKYQDEEENNFNDLMTVEIDGNVWFIASEVCKLLDIQNVPRAVSTLDEDEKQLYQIRISGQMRKVNIVSESGLYALIFQSKKPSAMGFRKWVTKEVIPSIRKTGSFGIDRRDTPNFITRFSDNWNRTEQGYFSVISELFIRLHGKFEKLGYVIPNKAFDGKEIRPDVSVGKRFSTYLKANHPDLQHDYKMYLHKFPSGDEFEARQYKNELLPIFIKYIDELWVPECAHEYFKKRDPLALEYIPQLIGK